MFVRTKDGRNKVYEIPKDVMKVFLNNGGGKNNLNYYKDDGKII